MNLTYIIKRPIVTEKSLQLAASHKYTFEVDPSSTKTQIKAAIAKYFKVDVLSVRTMNISGKTRRKRGRRGFTKTPDRKKAIIQLPKHQSIDLFESEEQKTAKAKDKKTKDKKASQSKQVENKNAQKITDAGKKEETQKQSTSLAERLTQKIRRTTSK